LITDPYYARLLAFTTGQALLSTLLTLAAGMPAAYAFARYEFRGKSLLRALTTIPFVMPTMVVAAAFTALLGPRGYVNQGLMALLGLDTPPLRLQQTLALVLLAHVFYNATIVVRLLGGFWANLDPRIEEAARVLGAGRWRTFREVTLPLLLPAVVASALLIFLFCFTSFGVILILGGPQLATIEVEIYYQAVPLFNLPLAAVLSIVQMVFTFAIMALYARIRRRPPCSTCVPVRPRSDRPSPGRHGCWWGQRGRANTAWVTHSLWRWWIARSRWAGAIPCATIARCSPTQPNRSFTCPRRRRSATRCLSPV
jgi:thiamine transport system permease protein